MRSFVVSSSTHLCCVQALLSCHVTALQDQLVSWFTISMPDLALTLLTVGFQTYSHDTRWAVIGGELSPVLASDWCRFSLDFQHPNNYRLRVSGVRLGDRGYYHCQLATHPPQLVWTYLDIVTPSFRKSEIISLMLLKIYLSTSALSLSESVALSTKQLIVS